MTTSVKTCFKCGETNALSAFYKHPQMADGRLNKCKECTKKDVSENYRANVEHYREYERERFARPERKENLIRYQRRRRSRSPEKYMAHYAVRSAVRDGRIDKPRSCEKCGGRKNIQAHHTDYSKPLDVEWLCFKCHRARHGQIAA